MGFYVIWGVKEGFDNPQEDSCDYINTQRDWFQDKIYAIRTIAQDMSGAIYTTMNIKDENMKMQYDNWIGNIMLTTKLGGSCTTDNTSPECMMLATPDIHIAKYANLSGTNLLELARLKLLSLDTTLTQELAKLNDSADIIGCRPNYMATQQKTFNTGRDIGYLATNTLRNSLQQLSPYYIDPALLSILMSYLIDDPRFLTRVNTIPANTGYINENLDSLFNIVKPHSAGSADLNNTINGRITPYMTSLRNYNLSSLSNGYSCAINASGYAQLSNSSNGWVKT